MVLLSVLLLGAAEPAVQPVTVIPAQEKPPEPTQDKRADEDKKPVPSANLSGSDFKVEVLGDSTLILEGSGPDLDIIEA